MQRVRLSRLRKSADPRDQATHEVVDEAGQSPNSRLLAAVGICWGTTGARTVQDVPQTLGNHTEAQGPKADVARRPHTATIVPMDSENTGRTHKDVNPKDNAAPSPRAIEGDLKGPRLTADDSIPYSHSTSSPLIVHLTLLLLTLLPLFILAYFLRSPASTCLAKLWTWSRTRAIT